MTKDEQEEIDLWARVESYNAMLNALEQSGISLQQLREENFEPYGWSDVLEGPAGYYPPAVQKSVDWVEAGRPEGTPQPVARSINAEDLLSDGKKKVTIGDNFVITGVEEDPDNTTRVLITGYYPGHQVQQTKSWGKTTPIDVLTDLDEADLPQPGDLPPISKTEMGIANAKGFAIKMIQQGVGSSDFVRKNERGRYIPRDPEILDEWNRRINEYEKLLEEARDRWPSPEFEDKRSERAISRDVPEGVGVLRGNASDLRPGDIIVDDREGVRAYFNVVDVKPVTVLEGDKPKSYVDVTGNYPDHRVETVRLNATSYDRFSSHTILRGHKDKPKVGTKDPLGFPQKPTRDKFDRNEETRNSYISEVEKTKDQIRESSKSFDISSGVEDLLTQPISPPKRLDFAPFVGDELARIIREELDNDPRKLKDWLKGRTVVFYDFESTGGFTSPSPIQVSAIKYKDGVEVERKTLFMNPEQSLDDFYEGKRLTGDILRDPEGNPITNEFLQGQMSQRDAFRDLVEFMEEGSILVAHNQGFDAEILREYSTKFDLPYSGRYGGFIDTLTLSRSLKERRAANALGKLAKEFGLVDDEKDPRFHDASFDTEILSGLTKTLPDGSTVDVEGLLDQLLNEAIEKEVDLDKIVGKFDDRWKNSYLKYRRDKEAFQEQMSNLAVSSAVDRINRGEEVSVDDLVDRPASTFDPVPDPEGDSAATPPEEEKPRKPSRVAQAGQGTSWLSKLTPEQREKQKRAIERIEKIEQQKPKDAYDDNALSLKNPDEFEDVVGESDALEEKIDNEAEELREMWEDILGFELTSDKVRELKKDLMAEELELRMIRPDDEEYEEAQERLELIRTTKKALQSISVSRVNKERRESKPRERSATTRERGEERAPSRPRRPSPEPEQVEPRTTEEIGDGEEEEAPVDPIDVDPEDDLEDPDRSPATERPFGVIPTDEWEYAGEENRPTEQQREIISAIVNTEGSVVVRALAGTGKTTTLRMIARRLEEQQPDARILYIAFNKSVQEEAERTFPENTETRTVDSLAHARAARKGVDLGQKTEKNKNNHMSKQIANFGISDTTIGERKLGNVDVYNYIKDALKDFMNGEDREISEKNFKLFETDFGTVPVPPEFLRIARAMWDDIEDKDGMMPFGFPEKKKTWSLENPTFRDKESGLNKFDKVDIVFVDEAQDTNPVLSSVLRNLQEAGDVQVVYVGDSNQSIYEFMGAVNELDKVSAEFDLPLTESWRFGPEIADIANRALSYVKSKYRVKGRGPKGEVVEAGSMEDPDAILARTNATVLKLLSELKEQGKDVGMSLKQREEIIKILKDFSALQNNKQANTEDLKVFKDWADLQRASTDTGHPHHGVALKWSSIIQTAGGRGALQELISKIPVSGETEDFTVEELEKLIDQKYVRGPKKGQIKEKIYGLFADRKKPISIKRVPEGFRVSFGITAFDRYFAKEAGFTEEELVDGKYPNAFGVFATKEDVAKAIDSYRKNTMGRPVATTILTAHKAKGLEWPRVKIADDFRNPESVDKDKKSLLTEQEVNLSYVALTRAERALDPGSLAWLAGQPLTDPEAAAAPDSEFPPRELDGDAGTGALALPSRARGAYNEFEDGPRRSITNWGEVDDENVIPANDVIGEGTIGEIYFEIIEFQFGDGYLARVRDGNFDGSVGRAKTIDEALDAVDSYVDRRIPRSDDDSDETPEVEGNTKKKPVEGSVGDGLRGQPGFEESSAWVRDNAAEAPINISDLRVGDYISIPHRSLFDEVLKVTGIEVDKETGRVLLTVEDLEGISVDKINAHLTDDVVGYSSRVSRDVVRPAVAPQPTRDETSYGDEIRNVEDFDPSEEWLKKNTDIKSENIKNARVGDYVYLGPKAGVYEITGKQANDDGTFDFAFRKVFGPGQRGAQVALSPTQDLPILNLKKDRDLPSPDPDPTPTTSPAKPTPINTKKVDKPEKKKTLNTTSQRRESAPRERPKPVKADSSDVTVQEVLKARQSVQALVNAIYEGASLDDIRRAVDELKNNPDFNPDLLDSAFDRLTRTGDVPRITDAQRFDEDVRTLIEMELDDLSDLDGVSLEDLIERAKTTSDETFRPAELIWDMTRLRYGAKKLSNGHLVVGERVVGNKKYQVLVRRAGDNSFAVYNRETDLTTGESKVLSFLRSPDDELFDLGRFQEIHSQKVLWDKVDKELGVLSGKPDRLVKNRGNNKVSGEIYETVYPSTANPFPTGVDSYVTADGSILRPGMRVKKPIKNADGTTDYIYGTVTSVVPFNEQIRESGDYAYTDHVTVKYDGQTRGDTKNAARELIAVDEEGRTLGPNKAVVTNKQKIWERDEFVEARRRAKDQGLSFDRTPVDTPDLPEVQRSETDPESDVDTSSASPEAQPEIVGSFRRLSDKETDDLYNLLGYSDVTKSAIYVSDDGSKVALVPNIDLYVTPDGKPVFIDRRDPDYNELIPEGASRVDLRQEEIVQVFSALNEKLPQGPVLLSFQDRLAEDGDPTDPVATAGLHNGRLRGAKYRDPDQISREIFESLTGVTYGSEAGKQINFSLSQFSRIMHRPDLLAIETGYKKFYDPSIDDIDAQPYSPVEYLLTHEWAHLVDRAVSEALLTPRYQEYWEDAKDLFTKYGQSKAKEGFAEAVTEALLGDGEGPMADWLRSLPWPQRSYEGPDGETVFIVGGPEDRMDDRSKYVDVSGKTINEAWILNDQNTTERIVPAASLRVGDFVQLREGWGEIVQIEEGFDGDTGKYLSIKYATVPMWLEEGNPELSRYTVSRRDGMRKKPTRETVSRRKNSSSFSDDPSRDPVPGASLEEFVADNGSVAEIADIDDPNRAEIMMEMLTEELDDLTSEMTQKSMDVDQESIRRMAKAIEDLNGLPVWNKVFIARNGDGVMSGAMSVAERPWFPDNEEERFLLLKSMGTNGILGGTGTAMVLEALREADYRDLPLGIFVPDDMIGFYNYLGFPSPESFEGKNFISLSSEDVKRLLEGLDDAAIMGAFLPDSYRFVAGTVRRSQSKARRRARKKSTPIFEPKEVREYEIWPPIDGDAGFGALSLPESKAERFVLPGEPLTKDIPDGHIRLVHQSPAEAEEFLGSGINLDKARAIEGPRGVYAVEPEAGKGFYGEIEGFDGSTVEFSIPLEEWEEVKGGPLGRSIKPDEILDVHEPWHFRARYMLEEPEVMQDIRSGKLSRSEVEMFGPDYVRAYDHIVSSFDDTAMSLPHEEGAPTKNYLDGPMRRVRDDVVKSLMGEWADRFEWEDEEDLPADPPVVYRSGTTVVALQGNVVAIEDGEWSPEVTQRIIDLVEDLQSKYPVGHLLVTDKKWFPGELFDGIAAAGFQYNPRSELFPDPWFERVFSGLTGMEFGSRDDMKVVYINMHQFRQGLKNPAGMLIDSGPGGAEDFIGYTLAHEWGHLLDSSLRTQYIQPKYINKYAESKNEFSTYGQENEYEGFAEAFAAYHIWGPDSDSSMAKWFASLSAEERGLFTPDSSLNIEMTDAASVTVVDGYSEDNAISIVSDNAFSASRFQKKNNEFAAARGTIEAPKTPERVDEIIDEFYDDRKEMPIYEANSSGPMYAEDSLSLSETEVEDNNFAIFVARDREGRVAAASRATITSLTNDSVIHYFESEDGNLQFSEAKIPEGLVDDVDGLIYNIDTLGATEILSGAGSALMREHILEADRRNLAIMLEADRDARSYYENVIGMSNVSGPLFILTRDQVAEMAQKLKTVSPISPVSTKKLEDANERGSRSATRVANATTMEGMPEPALEQMKEGLERLGVSSEEELDANIEQVLQRAFEASGQDSTPEGMNWYEEANETVQRISSDTKISEYLVSGIIAATSPKERWEGNIALADYISRAISRDHKIQVDDLLSRTVERGGERISFYELAKRSVEKDGGTIDGKSRVMPSPDALRDQRLSSLDPYVAASLIKAHAMMGHDVDGIGGDFPNGERVNSNGSSLRGVDAANSSRVPVSYNSNIVGLGRAVSIARGGDPDLLLNGHKVRSFFNNIVGLDTAPGIPRDVTVDSHALGVALGRPTPSSSEEYNIFSSGWSSVAYGLVGYYALVADAYRRVAQKYDLDPRQVQAITWIQWRLENG